MKLFVTLAATLAGFAGWQSHAHAQFVGYPRPMVMTVPRVVYVAPPRYYVPPPVVYYTYSVPQPRPVVPVYYAPPPSYATYQYPIPTPPQPTSVVSAPPPAPVYVYQKTADQLQREREQEDREFAAREAEIRREIAEIKEETDRMVAESQVANATRAPARAVSTHQPAPSYVHSNTTNTRQNSGGGGVLPLPVHDTPVAEAPSPPRAYTVRPLGREPPSEDSAIAALSEGVTADAAAEGGSG